MMPRIRRVLIYSLFLVIFVYVQLPHYQSRSVVHRFESLVPRNIPRHISDSSRPCETVHLAFIAENVSLTINLVKSILIHRHSSLHLHLISRPFTGAILKNFLTTWMLPYFNFTFYSLQSLQDKLSWIPNVKLKNVKDVTKLLLPDIVHKDVSRIIVIDSDVTFLSDIRELDEYFWKMQQDNHIFASVGHKVKYMVMPTVKDTAVLLMDLKSMRSINWFHLWHKVTYENPTVSFTLNSILDTIAKTYPSYHVAIPCYWGVYYNNNCTSNTTDIKLLLWHSNPVLKEEISYKKRIMEQLIVYDGKSLRSKPWLCTPPLRSVHLKKIHSTESDSMGLPQKSRRDMCDLLKKDSDQVYRIHHYFYGTIYEPSTKFETTLVTQISLDRLDKLQLLLHHWDGPISIAMYGTDAQAWNLTKFIFGSCINRSNLAIHVVFQQGKFYPVNYLRNVALNFVSTPYAFLNDGDFLPSYGLFDYLKLANEHLMSNNTKKRVLVVPAFDGQPGFVYPQSKSRLLYMLKNDSVRIFCALCAHSTHGPTNFSFWATTSYPYKIEWAFHFEPYVVVRSNVVMYDQHFVGYGWNKVSQITELKAQGHEFVVIPDGFVIHSPHKLSKDREIWKRKNFKFCINTVWKKFLQDLKRKYGDDCLEEREAPPITIMLK